MQITRKQIYIESAVLLRSQPICLACVFVPTPEAILTIVAVHVVFSYVCFRVCECVCLHIIESHSLAIYFDLVSFSGQFCFHYIHKRERSSVLTQNLLVLVNGKLNRYYNQHNYFLFPILCAYTYSIAQYVVSLAATFYLSCKRQVGDLDSLTNSD